MHHLIEVSLLTVFWWVEGTNVGPLIIVITMLTVYVTLAYIPGGARCQAKPDEYVGWGHRMLLTNLYWAGPNVGQGPLDVE